MAALIGGGLSTSAQTRVNANEIYADECLQFGGNSVKKDGETISMDGSWSIYGWYNKSWATSDLSDYSKITAVISDYNGSINNASIVLFINLFASEDAESGVNVSVAKSINASGETTIELDLTDLCPYRKKTCYVGLQNWETCSFKVKEFFLTKGKSAAAPDIEATSDAVETTYISLTGSQSPTPHKGVNIVRRLMSDGSVRFTKAVFK